MEDILGYVSRVGVGIEGILGYGSMASSSVPLVPRALYWGGSSRSWSGGYLGLWGQELGLNNKKTGHHGRQRKTTRDHRGQFPPAHSFGAGHTNLSLPTPPGSQKLRFGEHYSVIKFSSKVNLFYPIGPPICATLMRSSICMQPSLFAQSWAPPVFAQGSAATVGTIEEGAQSPSPPLQWPRRVGPRKKRSKLDPTS